MNALADFGLFLGIYAGLVLIVWAAMKMIGWPD